MYGQRAENKDRKRQKIQNDLTNVLIATAKDKGLNVSALADIDEKFGSLPKGDLENIIDPTNIHGWLQDKIAIIEKIEAYLPIFNSRVQIFILFVKLTYLNINYILYCGEEI